MDYCGPHGIPYEEFLEWSPLSQQAALEWSIHRRGSCQACGTHPEDWDEERGGHRNAYRGEAERCLGCEQRAKAMDELGKDPGAGWHAHLVRNDLPMWGGPGGPTQRDAGWRGVDAEDASRPAAEDSA